MQKIKQSESTTTKRRIPIYLVDATDGYTPETGVTSPTIYISKAGGAAVAGAGTFAEIDATDMPGHYYYQLTATECNTLGLIQVNCIKTGTSRQFATAVQIVANEEADSYGILSNGTYGNAAIKTETAAIKAKTDGLNFTGTDVKATLDGETVTVATNNDKTGYSLTAGERTDITTAVWAAAARTLTSYGTLIADIWAYATRTLSSYGSLVSDIATAVWGAVARTITGGTITTNSDKTGYSISGTKQTLDALNDITAASVWAVVTRELTGYGTLIADIWAYGTRSLTTFGTLVSDIWSAGSRTLTSFGTLVADTATAVWAVVTRTITGGTIDTNNDKTGYTVSTNNDKTGYSISGTKQTLDALNDVSASDVDTTLTASHGAGSWQTGTGGDVTIADSNANKTVIAKAMKDQDVSLTAAVSGSVYDDTNDNIDAVDTNVGLVKAKTDNLPASPADETTSTAIKAKTDLIPAAPATEGTCTAIKAKTDNLPADPTSETNATANKVAIIAEVDGNETKIDAVKVDTAAIKLKTDNLPADPATETTLALIKAQTDLIPATPANETTSAAIKAKTDLLPADPASEAAATANTATVTGAITASEAAIRGADSDDLKDISDEIAAEQTDVTFLKDVMEADVTVDDSGSPWDVVFKKKSTATELVRKKLYDKDGTPITTVAQVVGQQIE